MSLLGWLCASLGLAVFVILCIPTRLRLVMAMAGVGVGNMGCTSLPIAGVSIGGYGVSLGVTLRRPLHDEKQIAAYVARHDGINDPKEVATR